MTFFNFEADFVSDLRCIPMQVRFKLDTCGLKLKLHHWNQLAPGDRRALADWPCAAPAEIRTYRDRLLALVRETSGEIPKDLPVDPEPPWRSPAVPAAVAEKAAAEGFAIAPGQWQALSPLQRFALLKLSRPSHENRNFRPAAIEFGLLAPDRP